MKAEQQSRQGFTLIEVIITLVIAAIALAAVIPFLSDVFLRSHEPRRQLVEAMDLYAAMENVVAAHTGSLQELKTYVGPEQTLFSDRFRVLENRYVEFVDGNESSSAQETLLKVTLQNDLGETLTRLFAMSL